MRVPIARWTRHSVAVKADDEQRRVLERIFSGEAGGDAGAACTIRRAAKWARADSACHPGSRRRVHRGSLLAWAGFGVVAYVAHQVLGALDLSALGWPCHTGRHGGCDHPRRALPAQSAEEGVSGPLRLTAARMATGAARRFADGRRARHLVCGVLCWPDGGLVRPRCQEPVLDGSRHCSRLRREGLALAGDPPHRRGGLHHGRSMGHRETTIR